MKQSALRTAQAAWHAVTSVRGRGAPTPQLPGLAGSGSLTTGLHACKPAAWLPTRRCAAVDCATQMQCADARGCRGCRGLLSHLAEASNWVEHPISDFCCSQQGKHACTHSKTGALTKSKRATSAMQGTCQVCADTGAIIGAGHSTLCTLAAGCRKLAKFEPFTAGGRGNL
jgi:hypothetical protein